MFEREIERYESGDRKDWYIAPMMARFLNHNQRVHTVLGKYEVQPEIKAFSLPDVDPVKASVIGGTMAFGAFAMVRSYRE